MDLGNRGYPQDKAANMVTWVMSRGNVTLVTVVQIRCFYFICQKIKIISMDRLLTYLIIIMIMTCPKSLNSGHYLIKMNI